MYLWIPHHFHYLQHIYSADQLKWGCKDTRRIDLERDLSLRKEEDFCFKVPNYFTPCEPEYFFPIFSQTFWKSWCLQFHCYTGIVDKQPGVATFVLDCTVNLAVQMILIWQSCQKHVVAALVIVMPRSFSCAIQSITVLPSWTSPILWTKPE